MNLTREHIGHVARIILVGIGLFLMLDGFAVGRGDAVLVEGAIGAAVTVTAVWWVMQQRSS